MTGSEILALAKGLETVGRQIEEGEEDTRLCSSSSREDIRSFYLPTVSEDFYTGCFQRLRDLTMPRLRRQ